MYDPYVITAERPEGIRETVVRADPAGDPATQPAIETSTLNVCHVSADLLYRIEDPVAWHELGAAPAEQIVSEIVSAELIHYAARRHIDFVLYQKNDVRRELHALFGLALADTGLLLEAGEGGVIVETRVPKYVEPSFAKVTSARNQGDARINAARQAEQQILRQARSQATRIRTYAQAEAGKIRQLAKAEAEGFIRILAEYEKDPIAFRRRKSLEALAEVAPTFKGRIIRFQKRGKSKIVIRLDAAKDDLGGLGGP
jgi:regulator of protease activity HflC (stomatin/prohibitin superfamily)